MSLKERAQKTQHQRRRSMCLPSCFGGGSVVADDDDDDSDDPPAASTSTELKLRPSPSFPGFRKKKAKAKAMLHRQREEDHAAEDLSTGRKSSSSTKIHKGNDGGGGESRSRRKPPNVQKVNVNGESPRKPRLPLLSPKYDTRSRLAPHTRTAEPVRTGSFTVQTGSPEPDQSLDRAGKLGPEVGLSVLMATVAVMILFGRLCAVVWLCACFYLLPILRTTTTEADGGGGGGEKEGSGQVDVESEEYKKRVVLEGLLERNGRRPSGVFVATAQASSR